MSTAKTILGIVPTMQSLAIASSAYRAIPKKKQSRKKALKRMIGSATNVFVGTPLTQMSASFIAGMD